MINGILFDLDGTLVDTNELIIDSFKYTFEVLKKETPSREEIISCFGEPIYESMGKYFDDVEEAVRTYREYNLKYHDERISYFKGAKELLSILKNRGYKLAIVTSKNRSTALRALEILGLYDYFDAFVTSDDVNTHKPDPEPVLKACKLLNLSPKETIMVGDSIYDIISGRNAGSKTCGVLYSFMKEDLLKAKADNYVEHLLDIIYIINKNN